MGRTWGTDLLADLGIADKDRDDVGRRVEEGHTHIAQGSLEVLRRGLLLLTELGALLENVDGLARGRTDHWGQGRGEDEAW